MEVRIQKYKLDKMSDEEKRDLINSADRFIVIDGLVQTVVKGPKLNGHDPEPELVDVQPAIELPHWRRYFGDPANTSFTHKFLVTFRTHGPADLEPRLAREMELQFGSAFVGVQRVETDEAEWNESRLKGEFS